MTILKTILTAAALTLAMSAPAQQPQKMMTTTDNTTQSAKADVNVTIHTTMGDIKVTLFGDTPLHQRNFLKLAREGFYDGLLFHRVIDEFMIQGGDPDSRDAAPEKLLGTGGPGYDVDAEIVYPKHFHRRGALAAARQGDSVNPERRSSGSQFYIVTGKRFNNQQLDQFEHAARQRNLQGIFSHLVAENHDTLMDMRRNRDRAGIEALRSRLADEARAIEAANPERLTDEQRQAYTEEGGTPHLDGQYTVFGQVVGGMETVDAIGQSTKGYKARNDRPRDDIKITSITIDD